LSVFRQKQPKTEKNCHETGDFLFFLTKEEEGGCSLLVMICVIVAE